MSYKIHIDSGSAVATVRTNDLEVYLQNQIAMMMEMNSRAAKAGRKPIFDDPTGAAITTEIVPIGEGRFRIARRTSPIFPADWDAEDRQRVASAMRSYAERMKIDRGKGKYNDAQRLIDQDSASIEIGEIQSFASACV